MKLRTMAACAFCLAAVLAMEPASAIINGTVYLDDPTSDDASVLPSSTLAHADFTTTDINFNTTSSDSTTISAFLSNPTFTNLANGFSPTHLTDNSFIILVGQASLTAGANAFVVGHDDGVVLTMGGGLGVVVNQPGPTSLVNTPFTVNAPSTGLFSFSLQYAECCGGPANLVFNVNGLPVGNVPEPNTFILFAVGLAGLGIFARRKSS